jgi:hypothetical protein
MASKGKKVYSGAGSNVAKEAMERKSGGRTAYDASGSNVMAEAKQKTGTFKEGGKVEGKACGGRLDKRARGGGVMSSAGGGSADKKPFSSAKIGK